MHHAITYMHMHHTYSSFEPGSHEPCSKLERNTNSHLIGIFESLDNRVFPSTHYRAMQGMAGCDLQHPGSV